MNLIFYQVLSSLNKNLLLLFIFNLLILTSCSKDEPPSDSYKPGDILYGIVKKGIKKRKNTSRSQQPIGVLKYGDPVTFISQDTIKGIVELPIHDDDEPISEYWLKVNDADKICFIHGGGLALKNPKESFPPKEVLGSRGSGESNDWYIAVTKVNIRSDYNTGSKSLGKLQEGDLISSNSSKTKVGEEVKDCYSKSDSWFKINDGWVNGLYLKKIDSNLRKKFKDIIKGKSEKKNYYFVIDKVNIRKGKNTGSTIMGEHNKGKIIFSDIKRTGEKVDCYSKSDKWIKCSLGWVNKSYLIKLRLSELNKLSLEQ